MLKDLLVHFWNFIKCIAKSTIKAADLRDLLINWSHNSSNSIICFSSFWKEDRIAFTTLCGDLNNEKLILLLPIVAERIVRKQRCFKFERIKSSNATSGIDSLRKVPQNSWLCLVSNPNDVLRGFLTALLICSLWFHCEPVEEHKIRSAPPQKIVTTPSNLIEAMSWLRSSFWMLVLKGQHQVE